MSRRTERCSRRSPSPAPRLRSRRPRRRLLLRGGILDRRRRACRSGPVAVRRGDLPQEAPTAAARVIAPTTVLTAAHCVDGFNLSNFQVIAGRPNLRNGSAGQAVLVASGRVHPDFQQTALHDIAVLNLAQPTTVMQALATPAENSALPSPAHLCVAGYGAVNPFGVRPHPLKSTFEIVRTDRRCLKAYTRDLFAPESMICALGKKRSAPGASRSTPAPARATAAPRWSRTLRGADRARHRLLRRRGSRPPQAPSVYRRVSAPGLHQRRPDCRDGLAPACELTGERRLELRPAPVARHRLLDPELHVSHRRCRASQSDCRRSAAARAATPRHRP